MGQMWAQNFMRVIEVPERGVLLYDEHANKHISIADLSKIMQFELDKSFQTYQPHNHYDVVLIGEWD